MALDQLSQKQVAELLGISYDSFRVRRSARPDWFATPDDVFGAMPWWHRATVLDWIIEHDWVNERAS